jgi:hypothetical protein
VKRGGRLRHASPKRARDQQRRQAVVEIVHARANCCCWYAAFIPEIRCEHWDRSRPRLEVDELRGGSYRITEWLDPDACRLACQSHHRYKTEHKLEVLDRLARYEQEHPWPTLPNLDRPS